MSNDINSTQIGGNGNTPITEKDAQITLTGTLKQNSRTEMVVFSFNILMWEITAIVVIPAEGTTQAPVYLKGKLRAGL